VSAEAPEAAASRSPELIDESNLLGSVIRLAWPVVVQQVSFSMVQLVDTALVGHLGEDALAGVRLAGQLFWFSQTGLVAVGVGATAIVARAVGAGEGHSASRYVQTSFVLALAWGILMALMMWFGGGPWLGLMGAEPEAQDAGTDFLRALAFGMPFLAILFAGNAAQQGAGDTRSPMVIGIVVNIVNVFFAYSLINGVGPFPELGVTGSGLGATISGMVGAALVLAILASGKRALSWEPKEALTFDRPAAGRLMNIGIPAGIEQMQFNIAFMIYTAIIASLGTTALAAHGVTLAIQSLTFNVGFALSIATSALVGQSLGAHRPDLAERSAYVTMRYSLVFMGALAAIMMLFGSQIVGLFVAGEDAADVIDIGRDLLFIFAFAMPGLAVSLTLGGALRGAGDTRAVLYIMAGTTWIVRLVPAYLLAITFGLGVPGAWIAAILDINTRAALMWFRFRIGKWKTMKV
jgi:putative MATE family efflux protein